MASVTALRELLRETSLPNELVDEVLSDTNTLWLLGAPDELVAAELVLCHPPLGPGEVRAVVNNTENPSLWRVTVVTRDRPGLLAATSATLAGAGLSIQDAAVTVLACSRLAMQRLTVSTKTDVSKIDWNLLGRDLRDNLSGGPLPASQFKPRGPVTVEAQPQDLGRSVVTIEAPDGVGLLHASAAWFESTGCNVEAGRASTDGDKARTVFIVEGAVDTAGLAAALGGTATRSVATTVVTTPVHIAFDTARAIFGVIGAGAGVLSSIAKSVSDRTPTVCKRG